MAQSALAQSQQADEQRDTRYTEGEAVQRSGGGESAFKDPGRPALERGLIDQAGAIQGVALFQLGLERRHARGRQAQAEVAQVGLRPVPVQPGGAH